MFSKHRFYVEMEESTPENITMLFHSDLTTGEFMVASHIVSVGIFRTENHRSRAADCRLLLLIARGP